MNYRRRYIYEAQQFKHQRYGNRIKMMKINGNPSKLVRFRHTCTCTSKPEFHYK